MILHKSFITEIYQMTPLCFTEATRNADEPDELELEQLQEIFLDGQDADTVQEAMESEIRMGCADEDIDIEVTAEDLQKEMGESDDSDEEEAEEEDGEKDSESEEDEILELSDDEESEEEGMEDDEPDDEDGGTEEEDDTDKCK